MEKQKRTRAVTYVEQVCECGETYKVGKKTNMSHLCPKCRRKIRSRNYRQANPELIKETNAIYYATHKDEHAALCASWRERNRESLREYQRNYYHNVRKHAKAGVNA
jgi:hypothetical protein